MAVSPKSHKSYIRTKNDVRKRISEIEDNLSEVFAQILNISSEELKDIGEEILQRSLEIAPEDTGELKASAYIVSDRLKDKTIVEVGYTADHAVFVHENANRQQDFQNPTTPGTHWKFLETPAAEIEKEIAGRVADKIKKEL